MQPISRRKYNAAELTRRDKVFWKRICSLPTEPVWYLTNIFFNYVVIIYTLSYSVNTNCVDKVYEQLDIVMYSVDALYLVDIILNMLMLYVTTVNVQEVNLSYRPMYVLIIEMMSLFPVRLFLPLFHEDQYQAYCLLTLIRLLRLARVIYFHKRIGRISLVYNLGIEIFEFLMKLSICVLISYSTYCNTLCWSVPKGTCPEKCPYKTNVAGIFSKLINYGMTIIQNAPREVKQYWIIFIGLMQYFSYIFIATVAVANLTVEMGNRSYFSYIYRNMFKSLYRTWIKYKVSQRLLDRTYKFFKGGWTSYGGLDTGQEFYELLTPALSSEMMLDVCWPAFKHSSLFRYADIAYLRSLALVMTQEFVMPGDFIYRRDDWKDKMLYLADGTIEVLSEEDGESPILSFGSGTCLGEAGIILSYPSVNSVRAKTFCEFHVLNKRSFVASYKRYPLKVKGIFAQIMQRIEQAKKIYGLSELLKKKTFTDRRDIDTYTIYWLKNTLHKLMSQSKEVGFRHEFQNIYLVDEIDKNVFERLAFTASYLDMLVIKERVATDSDPIFVRTKFPFILQPNCVITVVWEFVIVALTLVVSFLVPYASFLTLEYVPGYNAFIYFATVTFVIDLMVQCCTAIKTTKVHHTTCLSISVARLQDVVFWADILSCVPLELYTPTILTTITPYNNAMLHLNKIIKLWRIEKLFTKWSKQFDVNALYVTIVKLVCIQIYFCYILYALLVYIEGSRSDNLNTLFDVVQVMLSVGLVSVRGDLYIFYLVLHYITVTLKWVFMAKISALYILDKIGLTKLQNKAYKIYLLLTEHNLPKPYFRRLRNNYECDWDLDFGRRSHVQPKFMAGLSTVNYAEIVDNVFGSALREMAFFQMLPKPSYLDLMKCMKFVTRPSNETIIYNGDIMNEIVLFFKGSLDVLDIEGRIIDTINTPQPLNLVDIIFDLPSMRTYVTKTTCTFVEIERHEFHRFLLKYPHGKARISGVRLSLERERSLVLSQFDSSIIGGVTSYNIYKNVARSSFYLFGYNLKLDSFMEFDYFLPFDQLYPLDVVRYLLMRFTILPNGNFIYVWEGVRSVVAILCAIVHFVNPLLQDKYKPLFYSLYAYGWFDMYLRLHVCYYDEKGILIKHPLKTAKYYLTHGFLIDFLSWLPFKLSIEEGDYLGFFFKNSVRMLPLGRYYQYMQTLKFSVIKSESKFSILLYAPLVLVLVNFVGSLIIGVQCNFQAKDEPDDYFIGFTCANNSFLYNSYFHKPISVLRAHLYGMYFASSFLLQHGFRGYRMSDYATSMAASILSFLGQTITLAILAKMMCMYSTQKSFLSEEQGALDRLKKFMITVNVSKRLMKTVVDTYEIKWKITKGRTIHSVMGPFSTPLRRDIYYEIYGSSLLASSPFQRKYPTFYRNILDSLTYNLVPKGGYLSTINDIEDTTYILLSGVADILSPDGSKLTTITTGAMFGNLERKNYSRIRVSIIAMSHVELFAIKSLFFYKILDHYPEVLAEYHFLRQIYFTYIPSKEREIERAEYLTEEDMARSSEGIVLCEAYNPHALKVKVWTFLIITYTCYLSILLDLYHMTCGDFSINILIMLYSSDILFIIYFLNLDRAAFEDLKGYLVTNLMEIKKRLRSNHLKTWISIASIIPIDILVLSSVIDQNLREDLYPFTRLNRCLRLLLVLEYFTLNIDKVNVKSFFLLKIAAIVCWTALFLVFFAAVLTLLACRHTINMTPHIRTCNQIDDMTSRGKIMFFIEQVYLAVHMLTVAASSFYYPHAPAIILLFVCSFIIGGILHSLGFGQVFALYNDIWLQKTLFKRRLDRLYYFMEREDVSVSLTARVKNYIQLNWITTSGEIHPKLMKGAPLYLKDAVMNSAVGHLIFKHPVFAKCHPDCLRQIVQRSEIQYYFADDYIQFKGCIDESMYFIFNGTIMVLSDDFSKTKDILAMLRAGDSFGVVQGLFRRTPHNYSYRCKRYSILIRLQLDAWEYLLHHFPATKQVIYEEIKVYTGY